MRIDAKNFQLFDFSAKLDPVPAMLIQNHQDNDKRFSWIIDIFQSEYH